MSSSTVQSEAASPYNLHPMPDADITGAAGILAQVPHLQFYAKVGRDVGTEAAYQTYTCPNAIACGYTTTLDAASRPIGSINPLGYVRSTVWDQASRQVASVDSLGNYATSIYSGNGSLIASQNELGYSTSFVLLAAGVDEAAQPVNEPA